MGSIDGTAGSDSISAGGGSDPINAYGGNDTITDSGGMDTVYGGAGNDWINVSDGARDDVYGGTGDDTVFATGSDADYVWGDGGNDSLTLGNGANQVYGGTENDTIWAQGGQDTVYGDAGADLVYGGSGNDWVQLGDGNDRFGAWSSDDSGNDTIFGGLGDDEIIGGANDDIVYGEAGNDTLSGQSGRDTLYGAAGNDVFVITDDHDYDSIDGGTSADFDFIQFGNYSSTLGVGVTLSGTGAGSYDFAGTTGAGDFTHIEGLGLTEYGDTLYGGADGGGLDIYGGGGADSIVTGAGQDLVFGGAGNDTLEGGAGHDALYGDAGNDTLYGGAGDDLLNGGAGNDWLYGGDGNDTLQFFDTGNSSLDGGAGYDIIDLSGATTGDGWISFWNFEEIQGSNYGDYLFWSGGNVLYSGGTGNDTIQGGVDNDTMQGGAGNDTLAGGMGNDQIQAGAGDDRVTDETLGNTQGGGADTVDLGDGNDVFTGSGQGPADRDLVQGGAGNDTITVQQAYDTVYGGDGDDQITSLNEDPTWGDQLYGDAGHDTITGANTNDLLYGGTGNDALYGAGNGDQLYGGAGNDTLSGGAGNDWLAGGGNADLYRFETASGQDTIGDFDLGTDSLTGQTTDQLDVSALVTGSGQPVKTFDVLVTDDGLGNAVLSFPGGESVTVIGLSPTMAATPGTLHAMGIPCFAEGTRILTPRGERPVEEIAPGDMVVTARGPAPVLWHGWRHLDAGALRDQPQLRPIHLQAGRFGNRRDLVLSPLHAVWTRGRLVRARHLALWAQGARIARGKASVTYHHLLLPHHALIRAEGAWTESFYPGPMALAALAPRDRARLVRAILALHPGARRGASLAEVYGPPVQPILTAQEARRVLAPPLDTTRPWVLGQGVAT